MMKQQIGEYLKIPGMPDSYLMIVGYTYDEAGNVKDYLTEWQEPPYITFGKVIYKTPIIQ